MTATKSKSQFIGPRQNWDQFIQKKPKWISDRLQNVHFFSDSGTFDAKKIEDAIIEEKYLLLVSDGSLKYIHMMSFGWILCTPSNKWLVVSSGPGSGEGSSLRIEADGMLSVALCYEIIADELAMPNFKITYICDNNTLIRHCKERLGFDVPFPNTTLRPEYDLIEEIYQTNKYHCISPRFEWVKGHRDDHELYDDLDLHSQLNIKAD